MSFRGVNFDHLAKFNSAASCDFIEMYESYVMKELEADASRIPHKTFAPSSFRCDRRSWFRIRGVQPDSLKNPDMVLNFTAEIGTACHRIIQSNLKRALQSDWIDVGDYVSSLCVSNCEVSQDESELETRISFQDPPVRFACDGIVRLNNQLYLLEIKSSEYSSWNDLTDPKSEHIDQAKCYCTLLNLDRVLFLYVDRQYGGLKCFEICVTDDDKSEIQSRFDSVMRMVESNLAPAGLPKGDPWCQANYCPYYRKCREYGR